VSAALGRVSCELMHSGGDRHHPCPLQVLVGEEKDPATGEVPVADARVRPLRLGSPHHKQDVEVSYAGAEGDVHIMVIKAFRQWPELSSERFLYSCLRVLNACGTAPMQSTTNFEGGSLWDGTTLLKMLSLSWRV
jgi:hypothetical protein